LDGDAGAAAAGAAGGVSYCNSAQHSNTVFQKASSGTCAAYVVLIQ